MYSRNNSVYRNNTTFNNSISNSRSNNKLNNAVLLKRNKTASEREYFIKLAKQYSKCAPYIKQGTKKKKRSTKLKTNMFKSAVSQSCYDRNEINKIIKLYNKYNKYKKIIIPKTKSKDIKYKYNILKDTLSKKCDDNEYCWLKQRYITPNVREQLKSNFKIEMPNKWYDDHDMWLNTFDIENVLFQYEIKFPEFAFLGATPIDFEHKFRDGDCVENKLCRLSLKNLIKRKKKYLGVVFNLDNHKQPGSHWISMFCNIPKREICYWDSYGYKPPKEVSDLMNKIKKQGEKINKKFKIKINNIRHQYNNSECGVYSIHFIVKQLEGDTFEKITKRKISDKLMNTYRSKYFNPY